MKKIKFSIAVAVSLFTFFSCRENANFLHKAFHTIKSWSGNISSEPVITFNSSSDIVPESSDLECGGSYSVHGDIYHVHDEMDEAPDFDPGLSRETTKNCTKLMNGIQMEEGSDSSLPATENYSFGIIKLFEDGN